MKKFTYNEDIGTLDVSEHFLAEGWKHAQKKGFTALRILKDDATTTRSMPLDLSPLTDNDTLKSLDIARDIKLGKSDLSPLYSCRGLTALALPYVKGGLDFTQLAPLDSLCLTGADAVIEHLTLHNVRDLLLAGLKNQDCTFLQAPQLEVLRISAGAVQSLDGLQGAARLQGVEIDHCAKLTDITTLRALPALSRLSVEKCKHIDDYAFLGGHEHLRNLFASDLQSVAFVPALKALESLKFWDLKDGDLTPLLNAPALQKVDFHPQKKHYSHSKEQINSLITQ